MRKTITKIICVAAAAISAAGLALSAGCASWTRDGVTPDSYENVTSNGGFAVQTDDYVYFVNGSELNTADNTFGTPLRGSIQRISKQDIAARNYSASQTVVPLIAYAVNTDAGIYVYGDRIYYATPSTAKSSSGVVQNSNMEFKSSTLDGSETMSDYYYRSSSTALDYRYVQPEEDGAVYLMYALSESLYGEASPTTNIHSVNTATGEDTLIAYNVSGYAFDTEDPTDPYVFYTMDVTYNLGSANAISEGYNQMFVARADATGAMDIDFSYVPDYSAEESPLYVNCGDFVYDGIGNLAYAERYSQFNYGYGGSQTFVIDRTDTVYDISHFKNGELTFTVQQSLDSSAALCRLTVAELDSDSDGSVDESWNAVAANDSLTSRRLLISDDAVDYTFVDIDGEEWALYSGENGLELGRFSGGVLTDEFPVTDSGSATLLAVREETTATESGDGTETALYAYYSLTGGNGYTFWRIALSSSPENYSPNKLPYEEVYKYSEVRILDLDAASDWYMPEFVGNTILFASETEGMTAYNYIMACDLTSADGDMMSNAELNAYNEKYEAVEEKIDEYSEENNSDGSLAYENLPDALRYAFYTGDRQYLAELIQAYVDIAGEDREHRYSERSAEIYLEFCDASGDWADYAQDTRTVNGGTVCANMQRYYYAVLGRMTDADADGLKDSLRASYMQAYPQDTSTWWDDMGAAWQVVFIVAMCVVGLAVLGGAAVLVIWLVRRKKAVGKGGDDSRSHIDITDDKDIDVYSEDN